MYLQYDTETSGIPDWHNPSEGPDQPHIVQIAAILFDASGTELGRMDRIVKPEGWEITDETIAIHGITMERAMDEGIREADALAEFMALQARAKLRSSHVKSFDNRIIRIGLKRFGDNFGGETQEERDAIADAFRERPSFCTAAPCTKILMLPPTEAMKANAKGFKYKTPDLAEAWAHFYPGEPFPGERHSAMGDTIAGKGVFLKLLGLGMVPDPDAPAAPKGSRKPARHTARADGGPAEIDLD